MQRSTLTIISVLILVLAGVGYYTYTLFSPESKMAQNEAGRSLIVDNTVASYTDLAGNPIDLSDYAGSVLVVNSWASWCPFCTSELPLISEIVGEYSDQNVVALAINRQESKEMAERYLRTISGQENIVFVLDPDDHFYESIGGFAMPETVIYDRNGKEVWHKRGVLTHDELHHYIDEAIAVK